LLLEGADLPRHRRLRQAELFARMGEASRLGGGMEDLELVPVHDTHLRAWFGTAKSASLPRRRNPGCILLTARIHSAAARGSSCAARKRSASSAAMHPKPAAVTAWRYTSSVTSPAAKTPGTDVAVENGAILM